MIREHKSKNESTIIVLAIIFAVLLFSGFFMMPYGGMWGMMSWMYPSFGFMFLMPILFIIALVLLIIWLIKQLQRGGRK